MTREFALERAIALIEQGWCKKMSAQNRDGELSSVTFPGIPVNPTPTEVRASPARFDIGGALFRALAKPTVPKGTKKEDARVLLWKLSPDAAEIYHGLIAEVCLSEGVMHHSIASDRCKTADDAIAVLANLQLNARRGDD